MRSLHLGSSDGLVPGRSTQGSSWCRSLLACHGTVFDGHVDICGRVNMTEIKGDLSRHQGTALVNVETDREFVPGQLG